MTALPNNHENQQLDIQKDAKGADEMMRDLAEQIQRTERSIRNISRDRCLFGIKWLRLPFRTSVG